MDAAVSLHDPSLTRPGRVAFAAIIYVAALAAAGLAGWGWSTVSSGSSTAGPDSQVSGGPFVAVFVGQGGAIALFIATGFALPHRWRASSFVGQLMFGLAGLELIAASVGVNIARTSSGGSARGVVVIAGLGMALMVGAALWRVRSVSRVANRNRMMRGRAHVAGLVTDVGQTGTINNIPHWRVVVRFNDASGETRWVTKRSTTWTPPDVGQQVDVYFDSTRKDDRSDIFVSW